jgi:transposase
MIADSLGQAIATRIATGQTHELPKAIPVLESLAGVSIWVVSERGHSSSSFRGQIWSIGARLAIPSKSNEAPVACPGGIYNNRNVVVRLWARPMQSRAVVTRYEKTARSLTEGLCLAAAKDRLRARSSKPVFFCDLPHPHRWFRNTR